MISCKYHIFSETRNSSVLILKAPSVANIVKPPTAVTQKLIAFAN